MDLVLRTAFVYLFILLLLRVTTRRILRSATPLDLVVIFLIGGFSMPSLLNNDTSFTAAILGMSTVAGLHFGLMRLRSRWPEVGMVTEGTPLIIYENDRFDDITMRRARVTTHDVRSEMRENGLQSLDDVDKVVVEHNGGITIVKRGEPLAEGSRSDSRDP